MRQCINANAHTHLFSCIFQAAVISLIDCQSCNLKWFKNTSVIFADVRIFHSFICLFFIIYLTCVVCKDQGSMSLTRAFVYHNRKRQLSEAKSETNLSSQLIAKRQKLEDYHRHQTLSFFWNNLSRQWLTHRALQKFDRRTIWSAASVSPHRTDKKNIDFTKLKRFVRQDESSLDDIRDVSSIQFFSDSSSDRIQYSNFEASVSSSSTMNFSQSDFRKRAKIEKESNTFFTMRKSSAYNRDFEQHFNDHDIYKNNRAQKPSNWAEINKRLAQSRSSLFSSQFIEVAFEAFQQINEDALIENKVMSKVFSIIVDTTDISLQKNLSFENLKDLTNDFITKIQPDFYDESRSVDLDKRIQEELGPYIVSSTNTVSSCVLNFYTKRKDLNDNTTVCKNQALYDDALRVRKIHELQSYVDSETTYNNNAYTITSTYHDDSSDLTIYSTHSTSFKDSQNSIEYCMTQFKEWKMTNISKPFRQEAIALRNARNWAKEKREELIIATNGKTLNMKNSGIDSSENSFLSQSTNESSFTNEIVNEKFETSADELGLNTQTDDSLAYRISVEVRTNRSLRVSSHRRFKKKTLRANKKSDRNSEDCDCSQDSDAVAL